MVENSHSSGFSIEIRPPFNSVIFLQNGKYTLHLSSKFNVSDKKMQQFWIPTENNPEQSLIKNNDLGNQLERIVSCASCPIT